MSRPVVGSWGNETYSYNTEEKCVRMTGYIPHQKMMSHHANATYLLSDFDILESYSIPGQVGKIFLKWTPKHTLETKGMMTVVSTLKPLLTILTLTIYSVWMFVPLIATLLH